MLLVTDSAEKVLLTAHEQPHDMVEKTIIFLDYMIVLFFSSIKEVRSHRRQFNLSLKIRLMFY